MFEPPGGNQFQGPSPFRKIHHSALPVITKDAPLVRSHSDTVGFKITVLDQFNRGTVRILNNRNVIDKDLTRSEHSHEKFMEVIRVVVPRRLHPASPVAEVLPGAFGRFIARFPGRRILVVSIRVTQFEARPLPIRVARPGFTIEILHDISGISVGVTKMNPVTPVVQRAGEFVTADDDKTKWRKHRALGKIITHCIP